MVLEQNQPQMRRIVKLILGLMLLVLLPANGLAQSNAQLPLLLGTGGNGMSFSVPVQTLLFFTALSFLPAILLMMTGFTRIVIVLSLLRQALGTQSVPPNQVIIGLSLFLTFFVMSPTLDKVYADAAVSDSCNAGVAGGGAIGVSAKEDTSEVYTVCCCVRKRDVSTDDYVVGADVVGTEGSPCSKSKKVRIGGIGCVHSSSVAKKV